MSQFIVRYTVELTALDQRFPLDLPVNATDVALRVLCRYVPPDTPPPPKVMIVTVKNTPDPEPLIITTRNFMLLGVDEPMPDDFAKYIGQVPFGPDKQLVNIIETLAVTPHVKE